LLQCSRAVVQSNPGAHLYVFIRVLSSLCGSSRQRLCQALHLALGSYQLGLCHLHLTEELLVLSSQGSRRLLSGSCPCFCLAHLLLVLIKVRH
jgi:hypothetical protein